MRIVTFRWARDAMAVAASGDPFTGRKRCGGRRNRVVLAPRPWRLSAPPVRGRQR
jgi:hypothetical protein